MDPPLFKMLDSILLYTGLGFGGGFLTLLMNVHYNFRRGFFTGVIIPLLASGILSYLYLYKDVLLMIILYPIGFCLGVGGPLVGFGYISHWYMYRNFTDIDYDKRFSVGESLFYKGRNNHWFGVRVVEVDKDGDGIQVEFTTKGLQGVFIYKEEFDTETTKIRPLPPSVVIE